MQPVEGCDVTCDLPPVTNANSHSHRPSPANSPIICSRLVQDPKISKRFVSHGLKKQKLCDRRPILVTGPLTKILQDTWNWVFCYGTDRQTHTNTHRQTDSADSRLNWPRGRLSENINLDFVPCVLLILAAKLHGVLIRLCDCNVFFAKTVHNLAQLS